MAAKKLLLSRMNFFRLKNKMKTPKPLSLLFTCLCWATCAFSTVYAGDQVTVTAIGISDSAQGAKRALVLDAITKVTSTYIMSKQVVTNEELDSRLAQFSDGVANNVTITSGPTLGKDGLWRVGGRVQVVRKNLIDSLREEQIELSPSVKSDAMFARAVSMEALRDGASEILDLLFEEDPRRYNARLVGELDRVPVDQLSKKEVDTGGIHWVTATVGISANIDAYRDEYASRLEKILNATTSSKSRYSMKFANLNRAKGCVYPLFNSQAEVPAVMKRNFQQMRFGAVTDTWMPQKKTEHIYKCLFMENKTTFGRTVQTLPVFSSRVKWMTASARRPFVGYNVIMIGLDSNGSPTLKCYAVSPAFFGPFERLLERENITSSDSGSTIIVSLKLINKEGELIKEVKHPLPEGSWLTPAGYAGKSWNSSGSKRIVLMPIGMSPAYCDALELRRFGRIMQKNIISAFNTISNAAVKFRIPLSKQELGSVSQVKIKILTVE